MLLLPLISFTLARAVSLRFSSEPPAQEPLSKLDRAPQLPLGPRLLVGLLGFVAALLVVWWTLYRGEFGLFNPTWIARMGDNLIHWPGPEIDIPAEVLLIITTLALWLCGLLDASNALSHDRIWRVFVVGVGMMVLFLLTISIGELDLVQQLFISVLVMLGAGMAALAFSSIKVTVGLDRALGFGVRKIGGDGLTADTGSDLGTGQSEMMPIVNRYWFASIGAAVSVLLLLGILLTLLIAPEVLEALLDGLWRVATFIGDIIANILIAIVYVIALIFFYIYRLLEPLLRRLLAGLNADESVLEGLGQQPEAEALPETEIIENAPIPDEYRWLGLAIAGLITLLIFALVIRRLSQTPTETLNEDRESILSADLLQDQLGSLWDRLMGRFRNQDPADPFLPLDGEGTRQRIRAVYQQLLATASAMGQPRQPAATPVEYEDRLLHTTPPAPLFDAIAEPDESNQLQIFYGEQFSDQLEVITAGYMSARYGDVAPTDAVADAVEAAWGEIERGLDVGEETTA